MMNDMEAAKAAMGAEVTTVNTAISDAIFGTDDEAAMAYAALPADTRIHRKVVPQDEINRVALRNNPNERAPDGIHSANKKWVRKRNIWRRQYDDLAQIIKFTKDDLRRMPSPQTVVILRALQDRARAMMLDRAAIGYWLRNTAHPWV